MSNSSKEFRDALQAQLDVFKRKIAYPTPSAFDIEAYVFMLTDEGFDDLVRRTRPHRDGTGGRP